MGEDLPCYSNKISPVGLSKCPRCHQPTDRAYLSDIRVTNISKRLTYKMAATKTSWRRYGTKLRHCQPIYSRLRPEIGVWEFDHINLDL